MIRFLVVSVLVCGWFAGLAGAETFKLIDGKTIVGELLESGSDEASALIRVGGDDYQRVAWGQFSQENLKAFKEKYASNKKILESVEPFIEITAEERAAKTEVKIEPPPQIVVDMQKERAEPKGSVIGSLFQSGLGWFLVVLIYGANLFAGLEIAIFKARPKALVVGLAAVPFAGFISNIVFISMPTGFESKAEAEMAEIEAARQEPTPTIDIPGRAEAAVEQHVAAAQAAVAGLKPEVYSRGKFTFNKRFFETKFVGFFGMTRSDENKPKVLIVKSTKGEFVVERITRVTPSDLFIMPAGAVGEVSMHYSEIAEVTLKPHA